MPQSAAFVLTTPLYYVNGLPHMGSAYTTMAADARARFERLCGRPVVLITGTDEHGQKIQRTAQGGGLSPQAHCDAIVQNFTELWAHLGIRYDRFIRTTAPTHHQVVHAFFQRVWDRGDIYQGRQQGWYCVACEEFKEERELLPGQVCPIHTNQAVEWRDETNYFFRLSRYQTALEDLYAAQPSFIQPETRRNEVLQFVRQGLQDFSISRLIDWGIPVPADPQQTLYVWFDALVGYLSALVPPDQPATLETVVAQGWPASLHLIGKDILRFHAVYWPAMLISAGLPLPQQVYGHGFLTKDGQKMGKTLGNTLDPLALVQQYGADAVRYYFLKEIEFGRDGDFNEERFVQVVNADLANDVGNLLNRTLNMTVRYCQGHVPAVDPHSLADDHPLARVGRTLGEQVAEDYTQLAFSRAAGRVLTLAQAANKYIDEQAPWSRYKQGDHPAVAQILYSVLESVRLCAYLLSPLIPTTSTAMYRQLGFPVSLGEPPLPPYDRHSQWGILPAGQVLGQAQPVFQRLAAPALPSS